jgi:iron complex transport system permease protein
MFVAAAALAGRRVGGASSHGADRSGSSLLFSGHDDAPAVFPRVRRGKAAVFRTVGDLGKSDWNKLAIITPLVVTGTGILLWKARDLNLMNMGEERAKSLGINTGRIRVFTMVASTLIVAGVVSFNGTIWFIGFVAQHIVRMIIGADNKVLVPASGLVGTVTAFLGVPLFVYLIVRKSGTLV